MNKLKFYLGLLNVSRKRHLSERDYKNFQEFQSREVVKDISKILPVKKSSFVIDLGCGRGGYTEQLAKTYKKVIGVDYHVDPLKGEKAQYKTANILNLKLKEKADLIFCSSVIEHVQNPLDLINSIKRSLSKNGCLYLSFPPFYSIGGGHQLKPFHFLPERFAIRVGKALRKIGKQVNSYENLFGNWGLYKLNIKKVKEMLISQGFKIIECKPRYFNQINTAKLPRFLSDLMTWHVEFYCKYDKKTKYPFKNSTNSGLALVGESNE